MDPTIVFCPNPDCPARGQVGKGNIGIHHRKERRYICHQCKRTFSETKGTVYYRLRTDRDEVDKVLVLLAHGCPVPAIVEAFGFKEETVARWAQRAGEHCQKLHEHEVGWHRLDLGQVQADELKVKMQGGVVWMAMGIMVSTRLWLRGVVSPRRDLALIQHLVTYIHRVAQFGALLVSVDGLASYVTAFRRAFRTPWREKGKRGHPCLIPWPQVAIVQTVKRRSGKGRMGIEHRIVQGTEDLVSRLLQRSQGGGHINTAFIERLNATFRQRLAWLTRRTRTPAQQEQTLTGMMFLVGALYNFCDPHHSLRIKLSVGRHRHRWVQRTPAMAAGLTDHRWSYRELFSFRVPPPRWTPPKRRGQRSKEVLQLVQRWC